MRNLTLEELPKFLGVMERKLRANRLRRHTTFVLPFTAMIADLTNPLNPISSKRVTKTVGMAVKVPWCYRGSNSTTTKHRFMNPKLAIP